MDSPEIIDEKLNVLPDKIGIFKRRLTIGNSSFESPYIIQYSSDRMHLSKKTALESKDVLFYVRGQSFEEVILKALSKIKHINEEDVSNGADLSSKDSETRIRDVDDLLDMIINTAPKGKWCFRGQVNHAWNTLPSLLRKPRSEAYILHLALLKRFLLNSSDLPYLKSNDPIDYLMILQHFGMPTKLLDCTLDPLVALFFACHDTKDEFNDVDGKLSIYPIYQYEKLEINTQNQDIYKNQLNEANILELVFKRLSNDRHLFFEPMIKNSRMRAQDGCFFLFTSLPINLGEAEFVAMEVFHKERNNYLKDLNKKSEEKNELLWYAHLLIDKSSKRPILDELAFKYGISYETLFIENEYLSGVKKFYDDLYSEALESCEELKNKLPNGTGINPPF